MGGFRDDTAGAEAKAGEEDEIAGGKENELAGLEAAAVAREEEENSLLLEAEDAPEAGDRGMVKVRDVDPITGALTNISGEIGTPEIGIATGRWSSTGTEDDRGICIGAKEGEEMVIIRGDEAAEGGRESERTAASSLGEEEVDAGTEEGSAGTGAIWRVLTSIMGTD